MLKHALIIGGTKGLGKVVVNQLFEEGYKITVLARTKPDEICHPENLFYVEADLHNPDLFLNCLSSVITKRGKLNYLIFLQRFRGKDDNWNGDLDITLHATRKIIDHLKQEFHQEASIVMVSSMAGKFATTSQPLSYSVAKAGLNQMVQHYAAELGSLGIRVNAVSPCTFVKEESRNYYTENKKLHNLYQQIIPLKRMCKAEDVANVITFLCSPKSGFISGQNIIVDGGLSVINHESLARAIESV